MFTSLAYAQTYRNGVSAYDQLNKEYYIGALYLPEQQQDRAQILADTRPQKMVLKVTASRWSPRKFEQLWRQDLALNNNLGADANLTNQLIEFTRFPKENLTTGDELVFSYTSKSGTEVLLNKEVIFQSQGKKLFNALLRTWIGDVPNSQIFQSQILNLEGSLATAPDVIQRFESSAIPATRQQLVTNWKSVETQARLALAKAEQELKIQLQREAEAQKKAEEARKKAEAEKKQREEERKKALALAEQRKKEAEQAKSGNTDEQAVAAALAAQKAAEEKAAALAKAQKEQEEAQRQAELARLTKQYAQELYQWGVVRDVYKRVSYPEWARQFNQEGIVTIEFIVGNQGQLLGVTSISPADSGLLGQELKDAVTRAAPFKAFPVQLNDKQLRVVLDYEFTLEERVAQVPPEPKAPEGVDINGELTSVQKAVQWAKYKDQVIAQIESSIEYPFWAKDLKQEGTVAAEITVLADGSVKSVKITKRTRHSILNQEVELAVDRIGSFGAFPDWIEDKSITLEIEHTFKL